MAERAAAMPGDTHWENDPVRCLPVRRGIRYAGATARSLDQRASPPHLARHLRGGDTAGDDLRDRARRTRVAARIHGVAATVRLRDPGRRPSPDHLLPLALDACPRDAVALAVARPVPVRRHGNE